MNKYNQATKQVIEYLKSNHYCDTLLSVNRICFSRFGQHLLDECIPYSQEIAEKWFNSIRDGLSLQQRSFYRMALLRLNDVFKNGEVKREHDTRHLISYSILNTGLKNELDDFLKSLNGIVAMDTIRGYKNSCARFLIYLQNKGIVSISEVTYTVLIQFYEEDIHHGRWSKSQLNGKVSVLLNYFYRQGVLTFGFTRLFHYLSLGKGSYWNDVDDSVHERISLVIPNEQTIPLEILVTYRYTLEKCLIDNGYSKAVITVNIRAVELLILFLDMNGYLYSATIAMLWFKGSRHHFGVENLAIRRALLLIAGYHCTGKIDINKFFREVPKAFKLLPEWCKEAANRYENYKIQEGWEKSTLDMIRSSLCRFCNYLDGIGIRSFKELKAKHIKQFNENDIHKTAASKNAYNSRIRKFLIFLGDEGYLTNPMLFVSLACTSAPQETIVVVLTEDEMIQLNSELYSEDSALSLRKKAILLLGLKMGMRSSDIVKLEYDDIDWDRASIRFIQDKTEVEVNLPMPADVGNALFRYITKERGKNEDTKIFLSEKAPHRPIGRATCGRALKTALPDRQVEGSGFHVTRKTYATNLLRSGVGAGTVADALGQRGTASVHRYLSLDQDRMKMCALTLNENGIGGWNYGK